MDIRCNLRYFSEFDGLLKKSSHLFNDQLNSIRLTLDNELDEPLIMTKMQDGSLREWTRGYQNIKSFLSYGYVKIIQQCPFHHFKKCRGEKCQFYLIRNLTGDCSIKWNAILSFDR
jgi:hypothetical protein